MHGIFSVRVNLQGGGREPEPAATTEPAAMEPAEGAADRRTPVGHTAYSWAGGGDAVPAGHTPFSWRGAAPGPAQPGSAAKAAAAKADDERRVDVYCGNPMVQTVRGRVHLYSRRYDYQGDGGGADAAGSGRRWAEPRHPEAEQPAAFSDSSYQLFVLAVPSYMTVADFCAFLGPDLMDTILHMRVVRGDDPSRYMVLLQMKDYSAAEELRQSRNGTRFSSIADDDGAEICYVLYVAQMTWDDAAAEGGATCDADSAMAISQAAGRPRSPAAQEGGGAVCRTVSPPPPPGHVEVPRCPVCLERLDPHASGILTVLCNHSFHSDCLTQWGDSTCPVCRFCQQPEPLSSCAMCGLCSDSLWMCLVCGFVGCGRYEAGGHHALDHHTETGHNYAIELSTQRVWDYTGDCYVHRLIQNRVDGKMVELADPNDPVVEQSGKLGEALAASKHEQVIQEYEMLLTSTLDSQRHFYDAQLAMVAGEHERCRRRLVAAEKKSAEQAEQLEKAQSERGFLEEVNASMKANQAEWQSRAEKGEARVAELEEQVRDLMFFLEAQKTVQENAGEGMEGGAVEVAQKKKRGKKKKS